MKALRTLTNYPPGSLMNPAFRYRTADKTDVRVTWARYRRAQAKAAANDAQMVLPVGGALGGGKPA